MALVLESDKSMKEKLEEMERKLQEKEKELELRIIPDVVGSSEHGIVKGMSQVSIKELEITGWKNQNKNLEDIAGKRELERKKLEEKCKELVDKNNKLQNRLQESQPYMEKNISSGMY